MTAAANMASSQSESTPQGVESLPAELICAIFSFIHASSAERHGRERMAPVHTLTRVCGFWRALSHGLPELWTDIRILHCRPASPAMLAEYLRRSHLLPVDISLDFPNDVAGNQMAAFWTIILAIWAVAPRWRSLRIITTAKNFSTLENNVGRRDAPALEFLELRVSESDAADEPSLSFGSMPRLRSLVVHGITTHISDLAQLVGQLESLDLFGPSRCTQLVMDLAEHFKVASQDTQAIPHLRHLSLRCGIPSVHGVHRATFTSYMSSLTTLRLGNFRDYNSQALFSSLSTPLLEELTLSDLTQNSWDTFTRTLRDESITFPTLRSLELSSIARCSFDETLSTAFPALEHLSLLHTTSPSFFSALSASESPAILWPHLRSLAVNDADYRALCVLLEARGSMGCPVETLEVDSPQFIDAVSLQWLQRHVKTLKRHPRRQLDFVNHVRLF
ncbi:hypothetical protein C8R46DRAFT_1067595 [Mycena filopes]|nr:hypothetical protein C8R46DRAFT_1067595 [Mycena filopes]